MLSPAENLVFCQKLLEEKGFFYLTDLLLKENETKLFKTVEQYALEKFKNNRFPQPKLFKKYKMKVSLIPPSALKIVNSSNSERSEITPFGQYLKTLYKNLEKKNTRGFLFLTAGGAMETLGLRPSNKSKFNTDSDSPSLDGDIVLFVDDPSLTEAEILDLMAEEEKNNPLKLKIITSSSRPFSRIDLGKIFSSRTVPEYQWDKFWQSAGHLTLPEFKAKHSSSVSFIQSLMGWENSSPYILLVPLKDQNCFLGAYINFFPKQHLYRNIFYQKLGKICTLKPTIINWVEIMFPFEESPSETLAHLIFFLKSSVWNDKISFINFENNQQLETVLLKSSPPLREKLNNFSEKTSQYLAQKIVYPIAAHPQLIIKDEICQYQWTSRLLKTMKEILNGNPYLGLIYLLAAGENPSNSPVYGTGIIDPKGFFPELYDFLHQENRLEKFINLMAGVEEGTADKGWLAFLSFIYKTTDFNFSKTLRLLSPSFCSEKIRLSFLKEFINPDLKNLSFLPNQFSQLF